MGKFSRTVSFSIVNATSRDSISLSASKNRQLRGDYHGTCFATYLFLRRWPMTDLFKCINTSICGLCLLALAIGGCGTLTGATVGGAAGAGIGAATHSNVAEAPRSEPESEGPPARSTTFLVAAEALIAPPMTTEPARMQSKIPGARGQGFHSISRPNSC